MKGARFAAQFLVHNRWEVDIKDHIVVDGQPQHNANQRELSIILKTVGVEPKGACLMVEAEHGCKVEQVNGLALSAAADMEFNNSKLTMQTRYDLGTLKISFVHPFLSIIEVKIYTTENFF